MSVFVSRSGAGAFGGGSVKIAQRVDPSTGDASEAAHSNAGACGFVAILAGPRLRAARAWRLSALSNATFPPTSTSASA